MIRHPQPPLQVWCHVIEGLVWYGNSQFNTVNRVDTHIVEGVSFGSSFPFSMIDLIFGIKQEDSSWHHSMSTPKAVAHVELITSGSPGSLGVFLDLSHKLNDIEVQVSITGPS